MVSWCLLPVIFSANFGKPIEPIEKPPLKPLRLWPFHVQPPPEATPKSCTQHFRSNVSEWWVKFPPKKTYGPESRRKPFDDFLFQVSLFFGMKKKWNLLGCGKIYTDPNTVRKLTKLNVLRGRFRFTSKIHILKWPGRKWRTVEEAPLKIHLSYSMREYTLNMSSSHKNACNHQGRPVPTPHKTKYKHSYVQPAGCCCCCCCNSAGHLGVSLMEVSVQHLFSSSSSRSHLEKSSQQCIEHVIVFINLHLHSLKLT